MSAHGFLGMLVGVLGALCPLAAASQQDDPASKRTGDAHSRGLADPPLRQADEKVGERLIRKATGEADDGLMADILRMMGESSRKLEIDFDPGSETQAVQARIIERLDEVIKVAASQRRPRWRSLEADSSDKRRRPDGKPEASEKPAESTQPTEDSADSTTSGADTPTTDADRTQGDLHELRRAWGHLPARERDEVIQGIGETHLQRYRDWIERYYRALQESEE
jgi:hypothetical protein